MTKDLKAEMDEARPIVEYWNEKRAEARDKSNFEASFGMSREEALRYERIDAENAGVPINIFRSQVAEHDILMNELRYRRR